MRLFLREYFLGDKPGGVGEFRARETFTRISPSSDPPLRTVGLAAIVAISKKKKTFFFLYFNSFIPDLIKENFRKNFFSF